MTRTFQGYDDGESFAAAKRFLEQRGFSVGEIDRGNPIGVMLGDASVGKWRNLDTEERNDLHGQLTSPDGFRFADVTLTIRDDAPSAVLESIATEDA